MNEAINLRILDALERIADALQPRDDDRRTFSDVAEDAQRIADALEGKR